MPGADPGLLEKRVHMYNGVCVCVCVWGGGGGRFADFISLYIKIP